MNTLQMIYTLYDTFQTRYKLSDALQMAYMVSEMFQTVYTPSNAMGTGIPKLSTLRHHVGVSDVFGMSPRNERETRTTTTP